MRETGPVRFRLGDKPEAAAPYIQLARTLLGQLKNGMRLGGIAQGSRTVTLPDGTVVRCVSMYGQDTVAIAPPVNAAAPAPPPAVIEEVPIVPVVEPPVDYVIAGISSGHAAIWRGAGGAATMTLLDDNGAATSRATWVNSDGTVVVGVVGSTVFTSSWVYAYWVDEVLITTTIPYLGTTAVVWDDDAGVLSAASVPTPTSPLQSTTVEAACQQQQAFFNPVGGTQEVIEGYIVLGYDDGYDDQLVVAFQGPWNPPNQLGTIYIGFGSVDAAVAALNAMNADPVAEGWTPLHPGTPFAEGQNYGTFALDESSSFPIDLGGVGRISGGTDGVLEVMDYSGFYGNLALTFPIIPSTDPRGWQSGQAVSPDGTKRGGNWYHGITWDPAPDYQLRPLIYSGPAITEAARFSGTVATILSSLGYSSFVQGIGNNGAMCGFSTRTSIDTDNPTYWTPAGTPHMLIDGDGETRAMSDDGLVVGGNVWTGSVYRGFSWSVADGITMLQQVPGSEADYVESVSHDGRYAVGSSDVPPDYDTVNVVWIDGVPITLTENGFFTKVISLR